MERTSISDDVYSRVRDAIVSGELRPGERLRDYELAETLGTSKAPVRHALDRLAERGLVEMQRNRFTRVAPIDLDRVRDSISLFGDIWIGSLRHAMPLIQTDDVAYLLELTEDISSAAAAHEVGAFGAAMRALAIAFARIEGNAARSNVLELLSPQIRRFGHQARDVFDWDGIARATADFRDTLEDRDAARMRAALVTLFDDVLPEVIDRAEAQARTEGQL